MMKIKTEPCLHLANALVAAAAPIFFDQVIAGLTLAAISVAHAINTSLRKERGEQSTRDR